MTDTETAEPTTEVLRFDPQLESLVAIFHQLSDEAEMGITVNVHGTILSGNLRSATAWNKHQAAALRQAEVDPESQTPREAGIFSIFQDWAKLTQKDREEIKAAHKANPDYERPDMNYLHLSEAVVMQGPAPWPDNGTWWRVRLSDVSAWSIGRFAPRTR